MFQKIFKKTGRTPSRDEAEVTPIATASGSRSHLDGAADASVEEALPQSNFTVRRKKRDLTPPTVGAAESWAVRSGMSFRRTPVARGVKAVDLNLFKTPGTRKAPLTPTRQWDAAPCTPRGGQAAPRTAPRTPGRNLASADGQESVKILVRVRPFSDTESASGKASALTVLKDNQISLMPHAENSLFAFDGVLEGSTTQAQVFEEAGRAVVSSSFAGYNSCVFAYGQTGSGKTHTMLGELAADHALTPRSGLIPRIFDHLVREMERRAAAPAGAAFECHVSLLEIYNESIMDLLHPELCNLAIREDAQRGVYVESLSRTRVRSVADVLAVLDQGLKNRHIGETRMNRESSRSHCVLTATLRSVTTRDGLDTTLSSRLNLVDLAGSEQQKSSGAVGERMREASSINKSLSVLGRVINTLSQKAARPQSQHVPYRDSKLTFLLQDSLGGNSKTVMIANISPSTQNIWETQSTLRFARNAKQMGNRARVNQNAAGDYERMRKEVIRLREENATLQRQQGLAGEMPDLALGSPGAADHLRTPVLGQLQPQRAQSPGRPRASPTACSLGALAKAIERAKLAEGQAELLRKQCGSLKEELKARENAEQGLNMSARFKDSKIEKLEKAMRAGHVDNPGDVICDTIESLKGALLKLESKETALKAKVTAVAAHAEQLQAELNERKASADVGHEETKQQLRDLQDLLGGLRLGGEAGRESVGNLLDALQPGARDSLRGDALSKGIEGRCMQAMRQEELIAEAEARVRKRYEGEAAAAAAELAKRREEAEYWRDGEARARDEKMEVHRELVQARTDAETMYHNQLVPAQEVAASLRGALAAAQAKVAELDEQMRDTTERLAAEMEARVGAQTERANVSEALAAALEQSNRLKAELDDATAAAGEWQDQTEYMRSLREELVASRGEFEKVSDENRALQWAALRAGQVQQESGALPSGGAAASEAGERVRALEHERSVLATEVQALSMKLEQQVSARKDDKEAWERALDAARGCTRAVEFERDAMAEKCNAYLRELETGKDEKQRLQATMSSMDCSLRTEQRSVTTLRDALHVAQSADLSQPSDAAQRAKIAMLQDEVGHLEAQVSQLQHELKKHKAAADPRRSLDSLASSHADAPGASGRVAALEQQVADLNEKVKAAVLERNELKVENEQQYRMHNERIMNARKENIATSNSLQEEHARKVRALRQEFDGALRKCKEEAKLYKSEVEGLLRGWTAVAASLLQLAAYTCGDGEPTGALSIRSSDENCNAANRDVSGLLAPDAAAAALQKGAAGAALGPSEQWVKVGALVKDHGKAASLDELRKGHTQLIATASDLLTWLNGSNLGM